MTRFNWSELFHFARAIEDNGERFYRLAAEKVADAEVRRFFQRLAMEEAGHGRLFSEIHRQYGGEPLDARLPEEHLAYLRAYVDGRVFEENRLDELVGSIETPLDAIRFAKRREQDAIHFYMELRELLSDEDRPKVEMLIAEERRHFQQLADLEATLTEGA